MTPLLIPSPSINAIHLGPFSIHFYALCILAGIFVAWAWGSRRFAAHGGRTEDLEAVIFTAVIAGIIGARVYHVVTDHQLFFGSGRDPWDAFKIWQGGLGIWGGVLFGAGAMWWMCRSRGWSFPTMADVLAPCLLVAQGIGRLGNWFNQELFGRPTTLPWALSIDAEHRPTGYEQYSSFHPTFLYEMVWNFTGAGVLFWLERRFRLGGGRVFMLYLMWYTFGRFFIEGVRIDPANQAGGLRVNEWVSLVVFAGGLVGFWLLRHRCVVSDPFPAQGSDAAATPAEDEEDGSEEGSAEEH